MIQAPSFKQPGAQRCEFGLGQGMGLGDSVADGEHQPIGGGLENQAHLVSAVRGQLRLVHLDQVLGLAARAIERVIDEFG